MWQLSASMPLSFVGGTWYNEKKSKSGIEGGSGMNYGFIGAGNMVSAIVKGMTIGGGGFQGKNIWITSKTVTSAK